MRTNFAEVTLPLRGEARDDTGGNVNIEPEQLNEDKPLRDSDPVECREQSLTMGRRGRLEKRTSAKVVKTSRGGLWTVGCHRQYEVDVA